VGETSAFAIILGGLFLLLTRVANWRTVVSILGSVVVMTAFTNLDLGLAILVFITYIRLSDVAIQFHGTPSIAKPYIALLAAAIVIRWILTSEEPRGWTLPFALTGAYGIVIFLSLFYAADFTVAQVGFMDFAKDAIIAIIICVLLQDMKIYRKAIWALLFAGLFLGSISVYQYLTQSFNTNFWGFGQSNIQQIVSAIEGSRIAGPIGDPNYYAQIMIFLVPLALNQALVEKSVGNRILAGITCGLCTLTAILTFSRGGFIALDTDCGDAIVVFVLV